MEIEMTSHDGKQFIKLDGLYEILLDDYEHQLLFEAHEKQARKNEPSR